MTPIAVHPDPRVGPCPVASVPDTPETRKTIREEWRRQADVSLAKILLNPVPKRKDT
jgi:hypothetical protein